MKKNLFLTGAIGCGKSTCIAEALGDRRQKAGGILTVRRRDETGRAAAFLLSRPDGTEGEAFLRSDGAAFAMHPEVFETLGVRLLAEAANADFVLLDEIGGFELLSDPFLDGLMALLQSDVPCIGVMKGENSGGKMIQTLGLGEEYLRRADRLRRWLTQDENTLLYECSHFDPEGLRLSRLWAETYIPD